MNAIVLAGGKSTRFGSNKALYKLEQVPMLDNIIEKLEPLFNKIYVIGDPNLSSKNNPKIIHLNDIIKDKGPLGGLFTALKITDSKYNYLQACDMPFIKKEYVKFIKKQVEESSKYEAYIPKKDGYLEPFAGIYKKEISDKVLDLINQNKLNFDYLYDLIKIKVIKEDKIRKAVDIERIFFNINKKEDIRKYNKMKIK